MNIQIDYLGGNCPVQAEGFINGKPFYFHARHEHWSLGIGGDPICDPEWYVYAEYAGGEFAAGWMGHDEALGFIEQAAAMYMDQTIALPEPPAQ